LSHKKKPVSLLSQTSSPALTAVSAVSDSSALTMTHYFALSELLDLSPEAQAVIFNEQRYTPNLWSVFSRSALVNLGKDWKTFERRGAPPPAVATPAPSATAAASSPAEIKNVTPAKLIHRPILSSSVYGSASTNKSRLSDVLRSDGDLASAVDEIPIPDLFKSVSVVPPRVKKVEIEVKKEAERVKGLLDHFCSWRKLFGLVFANARVRRTMVALGGDEVLHWWTRERLDRKAETALPNREVDVLYVKGEWIVILLRCCVIVWFNEFPFVGKKITALSRLTCASLTDDKFGVVQRDIPRILEAFCTFLDGLEAYEMELKALVDGAAEGAEREMIRVEASRARDVVGGLSDGRPAFLHL
jgi:nucleoporin NDC1